MKKIAILGSTGSIGRQTLDIIRAFPHKFKVSALAAGENETLLLEQVNEFKPDMVWAKNSAKLGGYGSILSMEEIASNPDVDIVLVATSGKAGLAPVLKAIESGKIIALANKEVMVMAGEIVTKLAERHHVSIHPVDSEHSAIWQCLKGERSAILRLLLTASGGPFYSYTGTQLQGITPEQALSHPTWKMGQKVTVDSATLMNKGLEVIEARWLFSMPYGKITVLYHPQSIVHSMIEFRDGSIKAQLSNPDMRLPIQYALTYPSRLANSSISKIDFGQLKTLTFEEIEIDRFPCLKLALEAGKNGGTCPAALCAADEIAVQQFLAGAIRFTDIAEVIEDVLNKHVNTNEPDIETIFGVDEWARETAIDSIGKRR
jgi:1-deoxy-D-xylulose-5-phosphate reductoisomerase